MNHIMGIADFGINDCFYSGDVRSAIDDNFEMQNVLLPSMISGTILTGERAKSNRGHTGLMWPREAMLENGKPIRRLPVGIIWRALIEMGDKQPIWDCGSGTRFNMAKVLAHELKEKYKNAALHARLDYKKTNPIIVIPDNLDENVQQAIIDNFSRSDFPEPLLLWRPVAAALDWLEEKRDDIQRIIEKEQEVRHQIVILYFGLDALEFTRLCFKLYNNHVVFVRVRRSSLPFATGYDWGAQVIENFCNPDDIGSFWQIFTSFPEIWQAIASSPYGATSRFVNSLAGWDVWTTNGIEKNVMQASAKSSRLLHRLISPSYKLFNYDNNSKFTEIIEREVKATLDVGIKDNILGIMACGPLLPTTYKDGWLKNILDCINDTLNSQKRPNSKIDPITIKPGHECLATGAYIFGQRHLKHIPSYLDTLPQLSLFAQAGASQKWYPLLDRQEVADGEEFKHEINKRFKLSQGNDSLRIILSKSDILGDSIPLSTGLGLSRCTENVLRQWTRLQFSYKQAIDKSKNFPDREKSYIKRYASHIFDNRGNSYRNIQYSLISDESQTNPFREYTVHFPEAPYKDIPLNITVSMRPASGFAKVSFKPVDNDFNDGQSIPLNYSLMSPCAPPQITGRGWPELLEIATHPEDPALIDNSILIEQFLKINPTSHLYKEISVQIRDKCIKSPHNYFFHNDFISLYPIDENGNCCTDTGRELLENIADKFEDDFAKLKNKHDYSGISSIISKATWLYGRTPDNIRKFIYDIFSNGKDIVGLNWIIEGAGKCFNDINDMEIFYKYVLRRADSGKFNIMCMRAASRLLRLRNDAPQSLNKNQAKRLAKCALEKMEEERDKGNFEQNFFQGALLLLYLLRYRKIDDAFLMDDTGNMTIFKKGQNLLDGAAKHFRKMNNASRAVKVEKSAQEFQEYLEYRATGSYPQAVLELSGE